jgi:Flp pilus assembly protein TadG
MSRGEIRGRESGQALVLIVLAVVGLLGLTALAVDGAHAFAQRRQAQNAADTAAFAAALGRIQNSDPDNPQVISGTAVTAMDAAGLARAASNNFADSANDAGANNGAQVDVIVTSPPDRPCPGDSSSAYYLSTDPPLPEAFLTQGVPRDYFVQVRINAQIPTFFAKVVGVSTLPIHVCAVAKALPNFKVPIGGDNGIVALGDVCDAVRTHGNGTTELFGGGVFSNSSANGSHGDCWSFNAKGTGDQIRTPSATVVGCSHGIDPGDISGGKIILKNGATETPCATPVPWPPPAPDLGISCSDLPVGTKTGTTAHPGRWSHALGNLGGNNAFPPNGVQTVASGVYCIDGNFIENASDTLTSTGGVTFILNGDLRWNAGATINLTPSLEGRVAEAQEMSANAVTDSGFWRHVYIASPR